MCVSICRGVILIRDFLAQDGERHPGCMNRKAPTPPSPTCPRRPHWLPPPMPAACRSYRLSMPATQGFVLCSPAGPYGGTKSLGSVMRADAKAIPLENVWFSRTKDRDTGNWQFWINLFDSQYARRLRRGREGPGDRPACIGHAIHSRPSSRKRSKSPSWSKPAARTASRW